MHGTMQKKKNLKIVKHLSLKKMNKIELQLPLRDIYVTQPFGENYLDFYKGMGLRGHNGIDFFAQHGCPIYSAIDGYTMWSGIGNDGGKCIMLCTKKDGDGYGVLYYHNEENLVRTDEKVSRGLMIAKADNTGKYTTGDHLHFELFKTYNGVIINRTNGYNGRIDPDTYFKYNSDGREIKPSDWDKSRAYHRYGRNVQYWPEFWYKFAPINVNNQWANSGRWVQKQLKKMNLPLLTTEQVNAIIYGAWEFNDVINPALRNNWAWLKKDEFLSKMKPFC